MAKLKSGINGAISGRIGDVVGGSWNGIPYIRRKPIITKPKTPAQLMNQHVFGLTRKWLQPIKEFLDLGFRGYSPTNYGINAAKSLLYKSALVKDGYNSYINPALAVVSYGTLGLADDFQVELNDQQELVFHWNPSTGPDKDPHDQVMLLAYNTEGKAVRYSLKGEFRKRGSDRLDLAAAKSGVYHIYAAFVAEDRSRQSMSVYLGEVEK